MSNSGNDSPPQRSLAIIGGGLMGIAAALRVAKTGKFKVTLFEKEARLGGLSSAYQWQDIVWDRFYHVILSTDSVFLDFLEELQLQHTLFWQDTKTGFYGDGRLVSLSSSLDFLTFPFMSLWQKFRMGMGILYSSQIKDPSRLDKIYVRQWLTKVFGRRVYEQIWDPLLRSKLGDAREQTSAAFIWATITRLYGARSAGNKQEKMGHVHGGYHSILTAVEKEVSHVGVSIRLDTPIVQVKCSPDASPGKSIRVMTNSQELEFDKVLFTIPCPEILQCLDGPDDGVYWQQMRQVKYLGVACVFLVLTRKLSPYYVINLLDKELPFTGIIEATNVVSPEELGGKHLVYLPKYMPEDDPLNRLKDEQIIEIFVEKLKKVYPDLQDREIVHTRLFREKHVQPLQELNYLDRILSVRTPLPGVYVANTSMIYNSTLNNNAVITLAQKAVDVILSDTANI